MCNNRNGNLLPLPRFNLPNRTCLTLIIDRVDIKNAGSYIDPFITVSVKGISVYITQSVLILNKP